MRWGKLAADVERLQVDANQVQKQVVDLQEMEFTLQMPQEVRFRVPAEGTATTRERVMERTEAVAALTRPVSVAQTPQLELERDSWKLKVQGVPTESRCV